MRLLELFNCLAMDLEIDRGAKLWIFCGQILVYALDLAVVRLEDRVFKQEAERRYLRNENLTWTVQLGVVYQTYDA